MTSPETKPEHLVQQSTLLVERLGYWPSFHDAEVRSLRLSVENTTLEIDVYVYATDGSTTAAGYFRQLNPCVVTLGFTEVEDVELFDWNHQNALNALAIERAEEDTIAVFLSGVFGLSGKFTCAAARVVSVEPTD
jgi:hypothetical protein